MENIFDGQHEEEIAGDIVPELGEVRGPFDIALTPRTLETNDAPSQSLVLNAAVFSQDTEHDEDERFEDQSHHWCTLGSLERLYEQQFREQAIGLLKKRMRVNLHGSPHITANNDASLAWNPDRHFLDMMVCVSSGIGLGALLPNVQIHHNYELTLDLKPYYQFHAKFAKLGFDPQGCMQRLGRSPSSEDVWLAWAPEEALNDSGVDVTAGTCSGATLLKRKHYRICVMFLARMLEMIGFQDIVVFEDYPDVMDDNEFRSATNIL